MKLIYRLKKTIKNQFFKKKTENNLEDIDIYARWIKKENKTPVAKIPFSFNPKISILMPVYNVELQWLQKAVESVEGQIYDNWELCIVDDCSTNAEISNYLLSKQSNKIKVKILNKNSHISITSNEALKLSTGEFIALLDHDDELTDNALLEVVLKLNENPGLDLIYSDEDKKLMSGERIYPAYKTNWNPELLFSFMYVGHLGVYRKSIVEEIGGFREGLEGAQDYDLILRFTERTNKITHIPKILYHWRMIPGSTAVEVNSKSYAYDRGRIALQQSLIRRGYDCIGVEEDKLIRGNYCPVFHFAEPTKPIAIFILASSNNKELIKEKIKHIKKNSSITNIAIVVLSVNGFELDENVVSLLYKDNDYFAEMFRYLNQFSDIKNFVFIKDTISVRNKEWLNKMLTYSEREKVGCVSGKVISVTGKLQYAGAHLQGDKKCYPNHNDESDEVGYLGRVRRIQNTSFAYEECFALKSILFKEYMSRNKEGNYDFDGLNMELLLNGKDNVFNPYIEFVTLTSMAAEELLQPHAKDLLMSMEVDKYLNPHLEIIEGKLQIII
ncbi:MAG: glycosyltransferase [Paenibacillus sp.]|nr:glycosyltransferase [Paenibacillus sp.]